MKKLVFISSVNPLSNIPGPLNHFHIRSKQAIAFEGISGEHLMELDTSSKLTTLQLLVMNKRSSF